MNVRNLGQGNKSWGWLRIASHKPAVNVPRSYETCRTVKHTPTIYVPLPPPPGVRPVPMLKGVGVILLSTGLSHHAWECHLGSMFTHCLGEIRWFQYGQWMELVASTGFLQPRLDTPLGQQNQSLPFSLSYTHTQSQTHANHLPCPKQTPTQVLLTG